MAGQDSHLLDDTQSFMKASHPPIPFDPQGLVALFFLYSWQGEEVTSDTQMYIVLAAKRLSPLGEQTEVLR